MSGREGNGYARARSLLYQVQPGRMEVRLRHSAERARPAARRHADQRALFLLIDRAADRIVTVNLWHGGAGLDACLRDASTQRELARLHFAAGAVTNERF